MRTNIQFNDRTVGDILEEIQGIEDPKQKGDWFEKLFQKMARNAPDLEIKDIWRWADWPDGAKHGYTGTDIGTDLVAVTHGGSLVAIQCKCYAEDHKVNRDEVKNFIVSAPTTIFDLRWFVATCDYNANAVTVLKKNDVRVIDLGMYSDIEFSAKPKPPRQPWTLQQEAIDAVVQGLTESGSDRGRLIMACGTGKTFTSLRITEALAPNNTNILFIAPSIALVAQTRREWLAHSARRLSCTVICSDHTVSKEEDIGITEISCETTTDPERIAALLAAKAPKGTARAVFCTYQSLDKLSKAQCDHGAPTFDLAIVDEAHRTTGYLDDAPRATGEAGKKRSGLFQLIHNAEKIKANKRLYMTATPRVYQDKKGEVNNDDKQARVVDMNDEDTYGREFYRLGFKKAVEAGMLCDYRVIALGIAANAMGDALKKKLLALNDDIGGFGKAADEQAFLALGAIALAINGSVRGKNTPGVLARTIAYASNIRRSKWFARALTRGELRQWIPGDGNDAIKVNAEHLDGTSTAWQRNVALRKLNADASIEYPRLITNAQLFTEGVDVPALNAIAFLDPRQSKVDTIQAVGRVMRRDQASGKVTGYIVVPVILPPDANVLDVLNQDQSRFKILGNVLRALQSHDERLYTELTDRLTYDEVRPDYESLPHPDFEPDSLLDKDAKQEIFAQLASKVGIAQQGKIIADAITQAVNRAAHLFMQEDATNTIAEVIGTPSNNEVESCKTAALLIANACIMHKRLEETGNLGGLTRIESANLTRDPASALAAAWATILKKDYAPVFQDATALLEKLPQTKRVKSAITTLIQCAIDNATTLNELGFDHAGPLYHSVLGSAQSDGAYYTKNLSAYLLAGLAFDKHFIDWKDPQAVKELNVIDVACGTGTLLMAALNIIKKRAAEAQELDEAGINELHKKLVEESIHGSDINKYSVQLAACNLTIGAPNTDYERMNLHTLVHGPVQGTNGDTVDDVRHGALEMLLDNKLGQMVLEPPPLRGTSPANKDVSEVVMPKEFNVVIYNPPFTKSEKQSAKYGKNTQSAMRARLQFIKSQLEARDAVAATAIVRGSIRPYFTPLAKGLLSKSGKLATIIPTTACTSNNGRAERQYITDNFHVEMVVTSHDPKHMNFSENTAIHESLLIASRDTDNDKPTRFIQLAAYPKKVSDADEIIAAIIGGDPTDNEWFSETLWDAEKVRAGDWTPVQWMNDKLAVAAGDIKNFPNLVVAKNYRWSSTTQTLHEIFDREEVNLANKSETGNAYCTIDESMMQTINNAPTHIATPKSGQAKQARKSLSHADYALVIVKYRTTSTRVVAVYNETPVLGNMYRPIGVDDPDIAKAYVAFMNSSFGIIQLLNLRSTTLTWITYTPSQMRTLMLPDPNKADLPPLLKAFEQVKDIPLERLSMCAQDPSRKILDHAAAQSIGVDPAITDQWREWLSREPTITNKPYQSV